MRRHDVYDDPASLTMHGLQTQYANFHTVDLRYHYE